MVARRKMESFSNSSFKDKFSFRRSTFSVFEQLGYLPESSFGFAGTGGCGHTG